MSTSNLAPLLRTGLRAVFVGTRPGRESLKSGMYYANPTNSFYRSLHRAGLTPSQLEPRQFRDLLEFGIGLDDVYDDPKGLRSRLEAAAPVAVCFNSRGALRAFGESIIGTWRGPEASRHASIRGVRIVWAVPDSSGLAGAFQVDRLSLLTELRRRIDRLSD